MRTKFLPVIAIAALMVPSAFAKKKTTDPFAEFKGSFKGTAGFVVTPGAPWPATCTLSVTGPKSGKSLRLKFSGVVSAGGTPAPYSNVITLTKNSYSATSALFNFPQTDSSPVSGKAKVAKKKIVGSAGIFTLSDTTGTVTFIIQSKTTGKKRTLTINYTPVIGGMLYPFTFNVSGKAK